MKKLMAVAGLLACLNAAQAQTYVTGAVGTTHASTDCSGTTSCDNGGTGLKVLVGYKFAPNVAVEGGYLDFGKAKASALGYNMSMKTSGLGLGVALHQDVATNWRLVGRLGVASLKTKFDIGSFGDDSQTSTQVYGGIGAGYYLTKSLSLDAGLDFSRGKYVDGYNVRLFSVGLTAGF